jgi:hypothetical protein
LLPKCGVKVYVVYLNTHPGGTSDALAKSSGLGGGLHWGHVSIPNPDWGRLVVQIKKYHRCRAESLE